MEEKSLIQIHRCVFNNICWMREGRDSDGRHWPLHRSRRRLRSPPALEGTINHAPAVQGPFRQEGEPLPQPHGHSQRRAHWSAKGRHCPSASKQKREGRAAVRGQTAFPSSRCRMRGVGALTNMTFALMLFVVVFFLNSKCPLTNGNDGALHLGRPLCTSLR